MRLQQLKGEMTCLCSSLALAALCVLASCARDAANEPSAAPDTDILSLDGTCNSYEIAESRGQSWTITDVPAWVTPMACNGDAGHKIRIYVESNSRGPREGTISIAYSDGTTRSVAVRQSDDQSAPSIMRTYAAGWSFDVRTYMDFRGLRDQIINTQKLYDYDDLMYRVEASKNTHIDYYYGESGTDLSDDMNAKLDIDGKFNSFSMDIQASFGKSALSNSKRIFSRIRASYQECTAYINQFDPLDAQEEDFFTVDFSSERENVIKSGGSDESIRQLIEHYGTHFVLSASLGGCYDYFFSSVVENMSEILNVEAAIKLGFSEKFKLNGDATYGDDLKKLNQERIEKFTVKGGDAISITMAVENGTISQDKTNAWLKTLRDESRYELLGFELLPLSILFPANIAKKIDDYTDRMYYRDMPVTRTNPK